MKSTSNDALAQVVKGAVQELQIIALLMRELATGHRTRLTLSDLILYVTRGARTMPYFLSALYSRVLSGEPLAADHRLQINNSVLETLDAITARLNSHRFSPANRRAQVAVATTARVCFSVTDFAIYCGVSVDTANRWLDAVVNTGVLRKLKVGNKFYFINTFHFATLQNMVFPLGEFQPPTADLVTSSKPKFPTYFPPYLESATPPF